MNEIVVDWTVNFGNLLTIIGFVVGGIIVFITMRKDLANLSIRLQALETSMSKLTDVMTNLAAQTERLDGHSDRIDRLERQVDAMAPSPG